MEVRYVGPDMGGREVDVLDDDDRPTGETVTAERLEWVELPAKQARSLARQDSWELRGPVKAAKTRKANEAEATAEADEKGES